MISTAALRRILDVMKTDPQPLKNITVKLFKAAITLTPAITPADFTEADFDGYTAMIVAPTGTAWDDDSNNGVLTYVGCHFQGTTGTVTNNIFGWWAESAVGGTGAVVVAAETFPSPIPMNGSQDAIDLFPQVRIGPVLG